MFIYLFDFETGAYLGEQQLTASDIDPRTHRWLVPGNATTVEPPRCDNNTLPVWRNDRWVVLECVADIPDELLEQCRKGMEKIQPSGLVEKIK